MFSFLLQVRNCTRKLFWGKRGELHFDMSFDYPDRQWDEYIQNAYGKFLFNKEDSLISTVNVRNDDSV